MKRLWRIVSEMALGFYLLLAAAFMLLWGAIAARIWEDPIKSLNWQLFPHWLGRHAADVHLYLWILLLFLILFLLGVNTFCCTLRYLGRARLAQRRTWAVVLFHCAFLLFLLGHLLTEFSGTNETVVVSRGVVGSVPQAGIVIEPLAVTKTYVLGGELMGLEAELLLSRGAEVDRIGLKAMKPAFWQGYSLHVAMTDKGLGPDALQLIVRRDYGLYVLLAGLMLVFAGLVLFVPDLGVAFRQNR